jgi:hypothetical protein
VLISYLAKLLGLWIVIAVASMAANRLATVAILNALFSDPALVWVTGIFTLLVGLAIVLIHNRWSGGATPVIVTFYGWAALVKGLLLLSLPPAVQLQSYEALHFDRYFYAYFVVALVLGGYLIYGGFKNAPSSGQPTSDKTFCFATRRVESAIRSVRWRQGSTKES